MAFIDYSFQMFFTFQLFAEETEIGAQLHFQDLISQDQVFYIHYFKFVVYLKYGSLAYGCIPLQLYQSPSSCIFYTEFHICFILCYIIRRIVVPKSL